MTEMQQGARSAMAPAMIAASTEPPKKMLLLITSHHFQEAEARCPTIIPSDGSQCSSGSARKLHWPLPRLRRQWEPQGFRSRRSDERWLPAYPAYSTCGTEVPPGVHCASIQQATDLPASEWSHSYSQPCHES